ncbi:MAG: hypothetical protein M1837_005665 [Sclerophora amabilis]|nr:MAG: hypothetical protein M1837_005665 [Sclerophora amabilis]
MQVLKSVFLALIALRLCAGAVQVDGDKVLRRQDDGASPTSSSPSSTTPAPQSSSPSSPSSGGESDGDPSNTDRSKAAASSAVPSSSSEPSDPVSSSDLASSRTPAVSSNAQSTDSASSTNTDSPAATSTKGTAQSSSTLLPIQPYITPGLSVAGVILLLAGSVFTLIGIKNRRIHIFLSTAFLASLAVTVLIIYVLHPPISNAIQGAYVVAAVITGLIFGALSIIFPEVTEGLGCLLGGFCLSMWFLVLKPGGLLNSTGAKAIFIAAFSITIFALFFSRYTRTYGLIGTISFGGATAVVLGIDCFSRAGLKEFWVYVWALNEDLLPLETTTFPHTRGIRVEIAAIIFIFLLGIISQMKLWKMIKERRDRKAAERSNEERHMEQMDENAGLRVEQDNSRDRAQWEAVYGKKDECGSAKAESVTESLRRSSNTVVESREGKAGVDNIELSEFGSSQRTSYAGAISKRNSKEQDGNVVTIRVARDEDDTPRNPESVESSTRHVGSPAVQSTIRDCGRDNSSVQRNNSTAGKVTTDVNPKRNSNRSSVTPAPAVIPLPFHIPIEQEGSERDDRSSIATFADSQYAQPIQGKRLSGASLMRRLSVRTGRSSRAFSDSQEALVVPHVEEDRASSVAATIDDLTDGDAASSRASLATPDDAPTTESEAANTELKDRGNVRHLALDEILPWPSNPPNPRMSQNSNGIQLEVPGNVNGEDLSRHTSQVDIDPANFPEPPKTSPLETSTSSRRISLTSDPDPDQQESRPIKPQSTEKRRSGSSQIEKSGTPKLKSSRSIKSMTQSENSGRESVGSLAEHLPESLSKVAMSYRTNEWAKHLESAELPDLDELKIFDKGEGIQSGKAEKAAPVNVVQLQQTPGDTQLPRLPRNGSQRSINDLHGSQSPPTQLAHKASSARASREHQPRSLERSASSKTVEQQATSPPNTSQTSLHNNSPYQNISRSSSMNFPAQSENHTMRPYRSSSTPIASQVQLGSLPEVVDGKGYQRSTPSPMPHNTLIGKRDSLIRNKYMSASTNNLPPTPEVDSQIEPSDSVSVVGDRLSKAEGDQMTLAQRKELLQQQRNLGSNWPLSSQDLPFDSHAPQRDSNFSPQKRDNMLAQWRESMRQDLSKDHLPIVAAEDRRTQMINERQQSMQNQRHIAMATSRRDSMLDEKMRRGEMNDLHKEALRRMQAGANKHV